MDNIPVHIIAGPTASGKSARAVELAQEKGGVVINADSMQIYDALPLLTAQPSPEEKDTVPHRLYGVMAPAETCNAQIWRDKALQEIHKAAENGLYPVITGGTGLYIKALTEGFSPVPEVPEEIRKQATSLQNELGNPAFHGALADRDQAMADKLNPNDTQRLIRAWEVLEATGKSLAYWQTLPPEGAPAGLSFTMEIVMPERAELYRRCDMRFDLMIAQNVLEEVEGLDRKISTGKIPADASITNALGFLPLQQYLNGTLPFEDAIELSKQQTRNYAKRQMTWIRNQFFGQKETSL